MFFFADVVFRSSMNEEWRLDFLAEVEITLLRFIMDVHYKPRDLEGLKIVMSNDNVDFTTKLWIFLKGLLVASVTDLKFSCK